MLEVPNPLLFICTHERFKARPLLADASYKNGCAFRKLDHIASLRESSLPHFELHNASVRTRNENRQ